MATQTGAHPSPEGASVDTISEKLLLAIWEHRLRPGSVGLVYLAFCGGLALGAVLSRRA